MTILIPPLWSDQNNMKFLLIYVPNLRFNNDPYKKYNLYEFATRVTRKNKDNVSNLPLTISAQYGLVDQVSFFNKTVASKDMSGYYLLKNGEFAYNKSYSNDYPWGAIKRLDLYDMGCLSTLYICFKTNDNIVNSNYLVHYFESSKWHKQVADIAGEGARNHGLLNIVVNDFFNTKHAVPTIENQIKIAGFLDLIEKRIQTQIKIIDDYNSLKMGIYNWMFKENYADYKLKQLAYIVKGDQINNDQLLSNGSYYMMNGGTSPSGYLDSYNVSENTISISEGGNSCGYVQFNSSPFWSGGHCYTIQNVNSALIENKYLYHYLKHKEKEIMNLRIGTGLPNIQKKDLENFTIFVPSLLIQRKNLALFEMLDEKICILNEELERLEMQKKYLLRNMFI